MLKKFSRCSIRYHQDSLLCCIVLPTPGLHLSQFKVQDIITFRFICEENTGCKFQLIKKTALQTAMQKFKNKSKNN